MSKIAYAIPSAPISETSVFAVTEVRALLEGETKEAAELELHEWFKSAAADCARASFRWFAYEVNAGRGRVVSTRGQHAAVRVSGRGQTFVRLDLADLASGMPAVGSIIVWNKTQRTYAVATQGSGKAVVNRRHACHEADAFELRVKTLSDNIAKRPDYISTDVAMSSGDAVVVRAALMRRFTARPNTSFAQELSRRGFASKQTWNEALSMMEGIPRRLFKKAAEAAREGRLDQFIGGFRAEQEAKAISKSVRRRGNAAVPAKRMSRAL